MKNTIILEAQFGLVLNWAFIAQSGRRTLVIIVMDILVKELWNVLSGRQAKVKEQFFLYPAIPALSKYLPLAEYTEPP